MPTIRGLKRRGYTPESIRNFIGMVGVSKVYSTVDYALLEHCLREDLNKRALRVMGVVHPIKLIIDNYPEGQVEYSPQKTIRRTLPPAPDKFRSAESFTLKQKILWKSQ